MHFICKNCDEKVTHSAPGTKNRNHCPHCLFSLHVDNIPGDRNESCHGLMKPIGKMYKPDGEEVLIHKCVKCSFVRKNRIAGDDSEKLVEQLEIINLPLEE